MRRGHRRAARGLHKVPPVTDEVIDSPGANSDRNDATLENYDTTSSCSSSRHSRQTRCSRVTKSQTECRCYPTATTVATPIERRLSMIGLYGSSLQGDVNSSPPRLMFTAAMRAPRRARRCRHVRVRQSRRTRTRQCTARRLRSSRIDHSGEDLNREHAGASGDAGRSVLPPMGRCPRRCRRRACRESSWSAYTGTAAPGPIC